MVKHYSRLIDRVQAERHGTVGQYEPIVPDTEGRLLSRTTGLWLVPAQRTVHLIDAATGEQLLTRDEEADRLRAELELLKKPGP